MRYVNVLRGFSGMVAWCSIITCQDRALVSRLDYIGSKMI